MIYETNATIHSGSLPGPNAKKLMERRLKSVSKGVSYTTGLFIKEAKGALIKDVDDNVFVDFTSGIGVDNIGHCDDAVIAAVKEQVDQYIHPCFNIAMYEPYVELAEKLGALTPGNRSRKVMFANSGAEAVENAVKLARAYTGKQGIISLECSFHGRTYAAMTLTSKVKPYKTGFGPFLPETYKIPSAYCYRCPYEGQYPNCGIACAEKLKTLLKGEIAAENVAGLILEPVQGEGGFIVPPKEYLKALESICKSNHIVFIVDEVQSGFSRTGKLFASEHYDLNPDILLLSKSIAGGMPLSAVIGSEEIMDSVGSGQIGGTFCGNPVSCAAALQVLKRIDELKLNDKSMQIGKQITDRLNQMKDKFDIIGDVRGLGAMVAVEFVKDRGTKEPYSEIIKKIVEQCYQKGVLIMSAGIFSNVIRFLPPLVMTQDQVAYGMDVLEAAIQDVIK